MSNSIAVANKKCTEKLLESHIKWCASSELCQEKMDELYGKSKRDLVEAQEQIKTKNKELE